MLAYRSHRMMLPSRQQKAIGTSEMPVSQLNTQPMVSPVNASRQTSRAAAHHSGSGRLARPYPAKDFHLLSFASLSWRSPQLAIEILKWLEDPGAGLRACRQADQ